MISRALQQNFCRIFLVIFFLAITNSFAEKTTQKTKLVTTTFDGRVFDLSAQRHKVVLVNFWVSWCTSCKEEMAILQEIYKQYKPRGLEIIGISVDDLRERNKASKIANKLPYPNALLSNSSEISIEEPQSVPTTYLITPQGEAIKLSNGKESLSKQELEAEIKPFLD